MCVTRIPPTRVATPADIARCCNSADALPRRRVYRRKDIAYTFGLPKSTLYELVADGKFPAQLNGWGRVALWDAEEVDRWYEALRAGSSPAPNTRH